MFSTQEKGEATLTTPVQTQRQLARPNMTNSPRLRRGSDSGHVAPEGGPAGLAGWGPLHLRFVRLSLSLPLSL